LMTGMAMRVLPFDDEIFANGTVNKTEYILNRTNHGIVKFRPKLDPMNNWAIPLITGHKYRLSWGSSGIDWEQMQLTLSERWE